MIGNTDPEDQPAPDSAATVGDGWHRADRHHTPERDSSTAYSVARRRVLQAIGVGMGLSAMSGLGQAKHISSEYLNAPRQAAVQPSGDEIHPVFGFSALSADVDPPVKPDHEVQLLIRPRKGAPIPEFFFEPTGLFIEQGDVVKFNFVTPDHTVSAYHPGFGRTQRVPEGVPPFSSPLLPGGAYWLYAFETAGVYDVLCAPHEVFGMVMRLVVGEASGPAATPLPDLCVQPPTTGDEEGGHGEPMLRLPALTGYTILRDPALAPDRIVEQGRVSWDDLAAASKQLFIQIVGFPPCGDPPC